MHTEELRTAGFLDFVHHPLANCFTIKKIILANIHEVLLEQVQDAVNTSKNKTKT
jgi:hypothetical protein